MHRIKNQNLKSKSMMTQEQIDANFAKYIATLQKYEIATEHLLRYIEGAKECPASTHTAHYGAYNGGLVHYLLTSTKHALNVNRGLPQSMQVNEMSLIKVCLLHQIGKINTMTPTQWTNNKQGKVYDYTNETESMKIGDRSAYLCFIYGVHLTDEEYAAIINQDKKEDDKMLFHSSMLTTLLRIGSELSIRELKINVNLI